ncbi:MAG: tRNA dihydrouridine synthase [Thermovirgaceae bacterium]
MKSGDVAGRKAIGGLVTANPFWIAPLAGITVPAVRRFFVRQGAGLTHTEMVSCAGILHGNRKTCRMLRNGREGAPTVLQLFAGNAEILRRGAERALSDGYDFFEVFSINMACPMPKVVKKGAGAALLKRKDIACDMVSELKKLERPVWVKMRLLFEDGLQDTLQFIESMLYAGADHVTLHGRTPAQRYEGVSDIESVLRAAREFPGKISASGDVFTPEKAMEYIAGGACAVLFARGLLRDAFIVERSIRFSSSGKEIDKNCLLQEEKFDKLLKLGKDLYLDEGEKTALVLLKRFLSSIFKGLPGASQFRRDVAQAFTWNEMMQVFRKWRSFPERSDFDV